MKKHGFTLAEVLITLLIVGVVATLTTPALVKNVGSSKIGPQLAKFVNTWETASETMMMEEATGTLNQGYSFDTSGMKKLSKYMVMTSLENLTNPNSIKIKTGDGTDCFEVAFNTKKVWQLKDGTVLILDPPTMPKNWYYDSADAYKEALSVLLVDIGGLKGSHRTGKEVFGFIIDDSGVLVPYGSNAHKAMARNKEDNNLVCVSHGSIYERNLACTGAVADNGWKAPW